MKKWRWLLVFACVLLVMPLLGGCQSAQQRANTKNTWSSIKKRGYVIVGLDDTFVPMGFRQKSGKLVGFDVDLARAVFKLYGIKVSFQPIDWSMKETELRNGTIDAIWNGYTKNAQREKNFAFSDTYMYDRQLLVTKKSSNITSAQAMKGKTLGLQSDSGGYLDFTNYPKVLKQYTKSAVQYSSFNDAFMDLNAKRINGILIDSVYADYYIAHQKDASSYRKVELKYAKEQFAVGLRKGDVTLRKKINAGLKVLAKNGTLKKLMIKWFGSTRDSALLTSDGTAKTSSKN